VCRDTPASRAYTNATALHYAAKAGFLKTIRVLLARGADLNALDDEGKTPLDRLARAAKSVRSRVRKLLLPRRRSNA
jgi:ankyrin repeat protein